jgi:hypothetical protein
MRGLAAQPFVTAVLGASLFLLEHAWFARSGERLSEPLEATVVYGVLVGISGLLVTAFGAYPALRWLLRRGTVTRRHALISGALLGTVPGAIIVGAFGDSGAREGELTDALLRLIVFGSLIGVASAAVFWWLAGRHLTDHTPGRPSIP